MPKNAANYFCTPMARPGRGRATAWLPARCKTGRLGLRNGPFRSPKRPVLQLSQSSQSSQSSQLSQLSQSSQLSRLSLKLHSLAEPYFLAHDS